MLSRLPVTAVSFLLHGAFPDPEGAAAVGLGALLAWRVQPVPTGFYAVQSALQRAHPAPAPGHARCPGHSPSAAPVLRKQSFSFSFFLSFK